MVTFTLEQLKNEVIRLGKENPDHVYWPENRDFISRPCYYVPEDDCAESCIFGQAILNLQPDLKDQLYSNGLEINDLLDVFEFNWSEIVQYKFDIVQNLQDKGKPWGVTIKVLEENDVN